MHYRYFMSNGMLWQYKIVEFCEIPSIGYLAMIQFNDFSAIQGQYRIYPAIRRGFCPSRMISNN